MVWRMSYAAVSGCCSARRVAVKSACEFVCSKCLSELTIRASRGCGYAADNPLATGAGREAWLTNGQAMR